MAGGMLRERVLPPDCIAVLLFLAIFTLFCNIQDICPGGFRFSRVACYPHRAAPLCFPLLPVMM